MSYHNKKLFGSPLEVFEFICIIFVSICKLSHVRHKNFLVKRCQRKSCMNLRNTSKSSFYMICLIFYDCFRSLQKLLFYSKWKVWTFSETLSPFRASYDKNSRFCFKLKFPPKFTFSSKSIRMLGCAPEWDFFANFACSHRGEFLSYEALKGLKSSGKVHSFHLE